MILDTNLSSIGKSQDSKCIENDVHLQEHHEAVLSTSRSQQILHQAQLHAAWHEERTLVLEINTSTYAEDQQNAPSVRQLVRS